MNARGERVDAAMTAYHLPAMHTNGSLDKQHATLTRALAASDALAGTKPLDHRIVEDDTPDLMVKHMPEIVYRPGEPKQMVFTVTSVG